MSDPSSLRIRAASWLVRNQRADLSRLDLQAVAVAVAQFNDIPDVSTGEAEFSDLSSLGFPCTKVVVRKGSRGIGVTAAFIARFNDGDTVILFVKEGRSLSLRDRNDIRAAYEEELRSRFDD
ncbi:MAG: hypothetical protein WCF85_05170 [Rhodospirillaceae bacterium]